MISIVIPTYKNKEQIIANLSHNMSYFGNNEIIVVNDYPENDLTKDMEKFKNIVLIQNNKNQGFGLTVNKGVAAAKNHFVMLLNNDVLLHNRSYELAVKRMEADPTLFAVSFAQCEKDNSLVGKNRIFWQRGLFQHSKSSDLRFGHNGWAEGGSCMINRRKYRELNGFDSLFSPFYWEDIDLSYRAWQTGYRVVFDPAIVVEHHHSSTIGKHFGTAHIKTISYRNQFIFIWKNITDPTLLLRHMLWLMPNIVLFLLKGETEFLKGLLMAILKIPPILIHKTQQHSTVTDKIILKKFV